MQRIYFPGGEIFLLMRRGTCAAAIFASSLLSIAAADDGYYFGRLVDGRTIAFSISTEKTNLHCTIHISGLADFERLEGTVSNRSHVDLVESEGMFGLRGDFSGKPLVFKGNVIVNTNAPAITVNATNIARLESWSRRRGLKVGKHGGGNGYKAEYPLFPKSNPFFAGLDTWLDKTTRDAAKEFVTGGYDNTWESIKGTGGSWDWESYSWFQISTVSERCVSLLEEDYAFTGGAHGNTQLIGHNFILVEGKPEEIRFADLFQSRSNLVEILSDKCIRELRRKEASEVMDGRRKSLTGSEMSSFTMDEAGITIHFSPYAVASYSEGSFHVFVPWAQLLEVLDPKGPARFIPGALEERKN